VVAVEDARAIARSQGRDALAQRRGGLRRQVVRGACAGSCVHGFARTGARLRRK
jgi:hypothetical protein